MTHPHRDSRQLRTHAAPERVSAAFAEPAHLAGWFADEARGEAVPGGTLTLVFNKFGMELPHRVLEVEPGRKLALEGYGPGGVPFRQKISIRIEAGETLLELVHSGVAERKPGWEDEFEVSATSLRDSAMTWSSRPSGWAPVVGPSPSGSRVGRTTLRPVNRWRGG